MFSPQPRQRPALLDKRAMALEKERHWTTVRRRVRARDDGRCRVCGKPAWDVHHVIFRSLGGRDDERNAIAVCRTCHTDVHGHVLKLAGDARKLLVGRWSDPAQDWVWR